MTKEFPSIDPGLSIENLISEYIFITGQDCFAITDQEKLLGIVNTRDIKHIPRIRWASTPVKMIMRPLKKVRTITSEHLGAHILEQIDQYRLERMPVLDEGKISGIVFRSSLYRLAKIRAQLKI
jgi:CBS domain-containing protein